jgi:hypothetical protein
MRSHSTTVTTWTTPGNSIRLMIHQGPFTLFFVLANRCGSGYNATRAGCVHDNKQQEQKEDL